MYRAASRTEKHTSGVHPDNQHSRWIASNSLAHSMSSA